MAIAFDLLASSKSVPTSLTTAYPVVSSGGAVLKEVVWSNTTDADITVTLLRRPSGGSGSTDVPIYSNYVVPSQDQGPSADRMGLVLQTGDALYWQASDVGLAAHLSGFTQ